MITVISKIGIFPATIFAYVFMVPLSDTPETSCAPETYHSDNSKNDEIFYFDIKENMIWVANADYGVPFEIIHPHRHGIECFRFDATTLCGFVKHDLHYDDLSIKIIGHEIVTTVDGEQIDTIANDIIYNENTTRIFYSDDERIISFSYKLKENNHTRYISCNASGALRLHGLDN